MTTNNNNNHNSKKRERTAQRIIEAVAETHGLLTLAAKKAGLSYWTVVRYANDFPQVTKAVQEAKEQMVDMAEGKLYQAISKGEAWAICFYLKTQAKHRGYVERSEVTGGEGGPLQVEIDVKAKLNSLLNRYAARAGQTGSHQGTQPEGG